MKARMVHEVDGLKTYVLIFDRGDEVMRGLKEFAQRERLTASHFTAIGAFERATLGYFDWERKDYDRIPVELVRETLSQAVERKLGIGD